MSNYFMGQGRMFAAERTPSGVLSGFRPLGNCPRFDVLLDRGGEQFAKRGAQQGGLLVTSANTPAFELSLESVERDNLALLLFGESTITAAAASTSNIVCRKGLMVPLDHINLTSFTHLKNGATTYVNGVHYTVNLGAGSIEFPANTPIPEGQALVATYVQGGSVSIGAFSTKQPWLALRFEGVNTVNGEPAVLDVFKTKFDPVDAMSLIGDNFSILKVRGAVHADEAKPADGADGRFLRYRQT